MMAGRNRAAVRRMARGKARAGLSGLALAALAAGLACCVSPTHAEEGPPTIEQMQAQAKPDRSYYLAMPDGVKLAVSLWLPDGAGGEEGAKYPLVLVQTRYGRAGLYIYGEAGRYRSLPDEGYALAVVDTRGSTSSFGDRLVEIGPEEVADMDALIRHFRGQPWSNGQVVATGVSYMADTADFATASPEGIDAAVIRESDFDGYLQLFYPGGIANDFMMNLWGGDTLLRDYGRSLDPDHPADCGLSAADCGKLWPRLQAVDGDSGFVELRAAINARRHWQPEDYADAEFRDDRGANGFTMFQSSPASRIADIAEQKVPVQYWGSWMDAGTAEGVLARYRSLPDVPMQVWITANNHGGDRLTDPLLPGEHEPLPGFDEQWTMMTDYLGAVLEGDVPDRAIHYYVLGAHSFKTTKSWPPEGMERQVFFLGEEGGLSPDAGRDAHDDYRVDFSVSSGEATRWTTQIGAAADYGDRAEVDRRLLVYTSEPFAQDMELAGTPSIRLFLSSATADPAIHAYIEDVAPDGRVTYLTEGLFRAVHRKPAEQDALPYVQPEPAHSFRRKDAQWMEPGEVAEIAFPTFPVAALIRKGHRLRISLAGTDAPTFRRYSEGGEESWRIWRGEDRPSALSVDLRPWNGR